MTPITAPLLQAQEIVKMSEIASIDNAQLRFTAHTRVVQSDSRLWIDLVGFMCIGCLCAAPFFVGAIFLDLDAKGLSGFLSAIGFIGLIILAIGGLFAGMILWFWIAEYWDKRSGVSNYLGTTEVTINYEGILIKDLGHLNWSDVLAFEGIPDCSYAFILHTRNFKQLMIDADTETVFPIIDHFMNLEAQALVKPVNDSFGGLTIHRFQFKALRFSYRSFMVLIAAGYVAGFAMLVLIFIHANSLFKGIIGGIMLAPMTAYMLWTPAFWSIDLMGLRKIRFFNIKNGHLICEEEKIDIDLNAKTTKVVIKDAVGLGYRFSMLNIHHGFLKRLDLNLDDVMLNAVAAHMEQLNIKFIKSLEPVLNMPENNIEAERDLNQNHDVAPDVMNDFPSYLDQRASNLYGRDRR